MSSGRHGLDASGGTTQPFEASEVLPDDPETAETIDGAPLPELEEHGTDAMISVEDMSALEEPTRRAHAADLRPLMGGEQTVTRTERGPAAELEATVVRKVPAELERVDASMPAEPTWAPDEGPGEAREAVDATVAMAKPVRPRLRVIPGGRRGPERALRPVDSGQETARPLRPPARGVRQIASPEAPVKAEAPHPGPEVPDVRWRWWLIGVLSATAWLSVAGALGWWVADLEIQADDPPELVP